MDNWTGIDWRTYFRRLSKDQMRELARWLAAEFLRVSEFTDILDRFYTQVADEWHGRSSAFIASYGWSLVERYACRKRGFAELMAAREEADMSGALPGDVASAELRPLSRVEPHSEDDVLRMLERVRGDP